MIKNRFKIIDDDSDEDLMNLNGGRAVMREMETFFQQIDDV
jgi:hypothetical protein